MQFSSSSFKRTGNAMGPNGDPTHANLNKEDCASNSEPSGKKARVGAAPVHAMPRLSASANYYEILGVPKDASEMAMKKAYRTLAIKYHPDKNPLDRALAEENFRILTEAYETLRNEETREAYDNLDKDGPRGRLASKTASQLFEQHFGEDPFASFLPRDKEVASPVFRKNSESAVQSDLSSVLPSGTQVRVEGLQMAPQNNGKKGRVVAYDAKRGHYTVKLSSGEERKFKRDHLVV